MVFPYKHFYFCKANSNASFFIPDVRNLSIFFPFSWSGRSLSILMVFSEKHLLVLLISLLFSISFISALILIISFLLLVLGLGCSSIFHVLSEMFGYNLGSFFFSICVYN